MTRRVPLWAITVPAILLVGTVAARLAGSGGANPWFDALAKPWFMPPGWAFPVVWTSLFILMGVALADLIAAGPRAVKAVRLFAVQFVLNLAWSPIFFVLHRLDQALAVLAALDIVLLATIVLAWRVRPRPALLLLPYAVWLGIATALNFSILTLNS